MKQPYSGIHMHAPIANIVQTMLHGKGCCITLDGNICSFKSRLMLPSALAASLFGLIRFVSLASMQCWSHIRVHTNVHGIKARSYMRTWHHNDAACMLFHGTTAWQQRHHVGRFLPPPMFPTYLNTHAGGGGSTQKQWP